MSRARKIKPTPTMGKAMVQVGDYVLLGLPGISEPPWNIGLVLWVGKEDILVDRERGLTGTQRYRDVQPLENIRAIGTLSEVIDIGIRAGNEVQPLLQAHARTEEAEREAKRAIFRKLDEFAKAEPMRNAGGGI